VRCLALPIEDEVMLKMRALAAAKKRLFVDSMYKVVRGCLWAGVEVPFFGPVIMEKQKNGEEEGKRKDVLSLSGSKPMVHLDAWCLPTQPT
jgi:hypothetical protein